MIIGTQLFGFMKELTEDMPGTFHGLRAAGFDLVEGLIRIRDSQDGEQKNNWAMDTLKEAKEICDAEGLKLLSAHVCHIPEDTPAKIAEYLAKAREISGLPYFVFSGMFGDEERSKRYGAFVGEVMKEADRIGIGRDITFLYHNHAMEFTRTGENRFALDAVLEEAGPRLQLELDFGWADYAGVSLKELERFFDKVQIVHLKDFNRITKDVSKLEARTEAFAIIGDGTAPIRETLLATQKLKDWSNIVILDQDYSPLGMVETLSRGYRNVTQIMDELSIAR